MAIRYDEREGTFGGTVDIACSPAVDRLRIVRHRHLDGDLLTERVTPRHVEVITAPEPAGVIPTRATRRGKQSHLLVSERHDLRAIRSVKAPVAHGASPLGDPTEDPPANQPRGGRERRTVEPGNAAQDRVLHLSSPVRATFRLIGVPDMVSA
ncbi:MAG: hypothetical protein ACRDSL_20230 [Pseudonocardiaceae bacterium]